MAEITLEVTANVDRAVGSLSGLQHALNDVGNDITRLVSKIKEIGSEFKAAAEMSQAAAKSFKTGLQEAFAELKIDSRKVSQINNASTAYYGLATSVAKLSLALQKVKEASPDDLRNTVQSLQILTSFAGDLAKASEGISELGDAMRSIPGAAKALNPYTKKKGENGEQKLKSNALDVESVTKYYAPLTNVANSIEKMGDDKVSAAIEKTSSSLETLGSAIGGLGSAPDKVNNLATGLRKLPEALQGFTRGGQARDFTAQIDSIRSALSKFSHEVTPDVLPPELANSIYKLGDGLKSLSKAGADANTASNLAASADALKQFVTAFSGTDASELPAVGDAVRAVSNALEKLNGLQTGGTLGGNIASVAATVRGFIDSLSGINTDGLSALGGALRDIANPLGRLDKAASGISGGSLTGVASEVGGFVQSLTSVSDSASQVGESIRSVANALSRLNSFGENGTFGPSLTAVATIVQDFVSSLASIPDAEIEKMERLAAATANMTSSMRAVVSAARAAASAIKSAGKASASSGKHASHGASGFSKLVSAFKRIALYRIIRGILREVGQAIKVGIQDIYRYSEAIGGIDTNNAKANMDSLASSALYVKNSLGAALMPVIAAITPVINALADAFATAANAIAAFFSALGGSSTFTGAVKLATEFDDGLKKAGGSAKELKRQLMGFDEINRIEEPNKGGGGGAVGPDASKMFDEFEVPEGVQKVTDWLKELWETLKERLTPNVEKLKNAWDKLKTAWDNLKGSGFLGFLGDVVTKVLEIAGAFAIDNIITVLDFFTNLADTLSKLSSGDWEGAINSFKNLVVDIPFDALISVADVIDRIFGTDIAGTLEKWKESVDNFDLAGWFKTAWDTVKQTWGTVSTWFTNNISKPISNTFNTVKEAISTAFNTAKTAVVEAWETVSGWFNDNIITPLTTFFTNLTHNIGAFFSGCWLIIQAVWVVVSEWFTTNVIDPLRTSFDENVAKISGFFSAAWDAIVLVWEKVSGWFSDNVLTPIENTMSPICDTLSGYFSTAWDNVVGVWETVSGWFTDNVITPIETAFSTAWTNIENGFTGAVNTVKSTAVTVFNGVISSVESFINAIIDGINGLIGKFNKTVDWAGGVLGRNWTAVSTIQHVALGRIQLAADGGFPEVGSAFIAGEAGPEFVGNIGGRTGVVNTDQMAQSVAAGNVEVVSAIIQMANMIVRAVNDKDFDVSLDGQSLAQQMYPYTTSLMNRNGNSLVSIGGMA